MTITASPEEFLKKWLSNKEEALCYLNAILEKESKDSQQLFLLALKHIGIAQDRMSTLAEKTKLR